MDKVNVHVANVHITCKFNLVAYWSSEILMKLFWQSHMTLNVFHGNIIIAHKGI